MQELVAGESISFGLALVLMFLAMLLLAVCSSCILLHSRRTQATDKLAINNPQQKFRDARNCTLSPGQVLHDMPRLESSAYLNRYQSQFSLPEPKERSMRNHLMTIGSKKTLNDNEMIKDGSDSLQSLSFSSPVACPLPVKNIYYHHNHQHQSIKPPDVIESPSHQQVSAINCSGNRSNGASTFSEPEVLYYCSADTLQTGPSSNRPPLPSRKCPSPPQTVSLSSSFTGERPTTEHSNRSIQQTNQSKSYKFASPVINESIHTHAPMDMPRVKRSLKTEAEYSLADESIYQIHLPQNNSNHGLKEKKKRSYYHQQSPETAQSDSENYACSDYNAVYCSVSNEEQYTTYQKVW